MVNNFAVQNFPGTINGDMVVAYTSAKTFRTSFVEHDLASLGQWYAEDPNKNHLGLVTLFKNIINYPMPMYMGMLQNGATIGVNGMNGTFRYDLPQTQTYRVMTVVDTSTMYQYPGIDNMLFDLVLDSGEYTANDVLTYDAQRGCNVVVSKEVPVRQEGDTWHYKVRLVNNGKAKYFPKDKLRAGIQYFKIGHVLSEFDTQFSKVTGMSKAGTMTCEFRLGNHRGVEGETTMYAGMKSFADAANSTKQFVEDAYRRLYAMRDRLGFMPEMALISGKLPNGNFDIRNAKVASTLEIFCLAELAKLEYRQNMFQQGGTIPDNDGVKYLNEGMYHQLRRGFTVQYSRPGGITRNHIREIAEYVYRGSNLPIEKRRIKMKVGAKSRYNIIEIFRDEFYRQIERLGGLLGSDRIINNPVSGPNDALVLNPVMIQGVFLPDIGFVQIEHDPSLDYVDLADRSTLIDGKTPWTSYSCIIEDVTSSEFSNAYAAIPNDSSAELGNMTNNVFFVKPKGESMWWGHTNGRWSSSSNGRDILSSLPGMGEQFWCHSASAVWVRDISRFATIELAC